MFQFNFVCGDREAGQTSIDDEPSNPGDNTAIELALPGCVDVTGTDQILEANNRDVITISDSLRLFKVRRWQQLVCLIMRAATHRSTSFFRVKYTRFKPLQL